MKNDYLGLDYTVSLILAIIPVTSLVLGVVARAQDKAWVAVVLRLLVGWNIVWLVDLVMMITQKHIWRLFK